MLDFLGNVFTSILGGGVTGILGVVVQRVADYKNKQLDIELSKQKFEHDIALRRVDAEIMAQEWAARTKVAEVEAAGKEAVADSQAFAASFNLEPQRYSNEPKTTPVQTWLFVVLDFIRGLVRPGLTIYLCVLTTMIYAQAKGVLNGTEVSPEDALRLVQQITAQILYLMSTTTLWYFGTRNKASTTKIGS